MDDQAIVDLLFDRNQDAIRLLQEKYDRYCTYIASNILSSQQDCEECVNDTYVKVWDSIPPARPSNLKAYVGKITRNLSLDMYDKSKAKKRNDCVEIAYDELCECIPDSTGHHSIADSIALKDALNGFLASLKRTHRIIFMQRYWYLSSVKEIAQCLQISESSVKTTLLRLRERLKKYLEKEGVYL